MENEDLKRELARLQQNRRNIDEEAVRKMEKANQSLQSELEFVRRK
jgi:cell fate (sporulation/competence/biofilm development) regulator YlbF (YheA/YmcA/DUF963 family)